MIELFSDVCPKTCDNFRALCTGTFSVHCKLKLMAVKLELWKSIRVNLLTTSKSETLFSLICTFMVRELFLWLTLDSEVY